MAKYAYRCQGGGEELIAGEPLDGIACLEHGTIARRIRSFSLATRAQHRDNARWDPVVGRYVANQREFLDALKEGAEREERELGMEVKLIPVDAADTTALCELHGQRPEEREADLEPTLRHAHDLAAT